MRRLLLAGLTAVPPRLVAAAASARGTAVSCRPSGVPGRRVMSQLGA